MSRHQSGEVAHAWRRVLLESARVAHVRTETVFETVMGSAGKDIVGETELFDVPQTLKMFSVSPHELLVTLQSLIRTCR